MKSVKHPNYAAWVCATAIIPRSQTVHGEQGLTSRVLWHRSWDGCILDTLLSNSESVQFSQSTQSIDQSNHSNNLPTNQLNQATVRVFKRSIISLSVKQQKWPVKHANLSSWIQAAFQNSWHYVSSFFPAPMPVLQNASRQLTYYACVILILLR